MHDVLIAYPADGADPYNSASTFAPHIRERFARAMERAARALRAHGSKTLRYKLALNRIYGNLGRVPT